MKFLPENKKKQIWAIILLVISVGGIVYFNFFSGPSSTAVLTEQEIVESSIPAIEGSDQADDPTGETAVDDDQDFVPVAGTSLLPYGTKIRTKVLDDDEFEKLQERLDLTVDKEELGKENLFIDETGAFPEPEIEGGG